MNRLLAVLVLSGVFLLAVAAAQTVSAQATISEEQINLVRQNCARTSTTLNQLHANDALLRNNRGRLYELISNKLMAPLGSRIALNRLDGIQLSATALEYDQKLDDFRRSYIEYEGLMTKTIKVSCKDRPAEFYESLSSAREKRQELHANTVALNRLLETYQANFEGFVKNMEADSK